MHMRFTKGRLAFLGLAVMGATMVGIVGCSSNATDSNGHAIGWRDTPVATKAPPTNVPVGTPVGEDGASSYAQPSNPLPPGGLPAATAPAEPSNANNNTNP